MFAAEPPCVEAARVLLTAVGRTYQICDGKGAFPVGQRRTVWAGPTGGEGADVGSKGFAGDHGSFYPAGSSGGKGGGEAGVRLSAYAIRDV